jgi:hypothetical protein
LRAARVAAPFPCFAFVELADEIEALGSELVLFVGVARPASRK